MSEVTIISENDFVRKLQALLPERDTATIAVRLGGDWDDSSIVISVGAQQHEWRVGREREFTTIVARQIARAICGNSEFPQDIQAVFDHAPGCSPADRLGGPATRGRTSRQRRAGQHDLKEEPCWSAIASSPPSTCRSNVGTAVP